MINFLAYTLFENSSCTQLREQNSFAILYNDRADYMFVTIGKLIGCTPKTGEVYPSLGIRIDRIISECHPDMI